MIYYKLVAELNDTPERVYRELLVSPYVSIYELGLAVVFSFRGVMEHMFYITTEDGSKFMHNSWLYDENDAYDFKDLTLNYLIGRSKEATLYYDTGEGYSFTLRLSTRPLVRDSNDRIIIDKARGYGIFEDSISLLQDFLASDLKFSEACSKYTDGSPWEPLGLELDRNATRKEYYKSITRSKLELLNLNMHNEISLMLKGEGDYYLESLEKLKELRKN